MDAAPMRGLKMLGMGKEVHARRQDHLRGCLHVDAGVVRRLPDRHIFQSCLASVADSSWMEFWKTFILINVVASIAVIIWFSIGGLRDLKDMLHRLKTRVRDHDDDGFVKRTSTEEHSTHATLAQESDSHST